MRTNQVWPGVRMRVLHAGVNPDAPPRQVTIPADWEDAAGAALVALAPGTGAVRLQDAADAWIRPLMKAGLPEETAGRLQSMLLHRQGAPDAAFWNGTAQAELRFILNLPAFFDGGAGFDDAAFDEAVKAAAAALSAAAPILSTLSIGIADLAGFIAAHGAEYGSDEGRALARMVAGRLRSRIESLAGTPLLRGRVLRAGAFVPDAADALLGVETGGIAPAFAPVGADGRLTRWARAFLAARAISYPAALAAEMSGTRIFPAADAAAHEAMHAALADLLDTVPAAAPPERDAVPPAAAPPAGRRDLPARHSGYTQKATLGGHRIYVRTGEYPDGALGELSIALPKDSPAMRGLMEAFAAAVSIGLQHGVPLAEYVEAFTQTRFGPSGTVEGDPAVPAATSVPDYVFRHLAANYLGQHDLPAAEPEDVAPPQAPPLLPLDLPADPRARRRSFRVVGG